MKKVSIKQDIDPEKEVPVEVLAKEIERISKGIAVLRTGRLNDKALLLLIQHAAPTIGGKRLGTKEIKAVLEGVEDLTTVYLRKKS